MANYDVIFHTSRGLLLIAMVLLACSAIIPARISAGSMDGVTKSEDGVTSMGTNKAAVIHGGEPDMNGCYHNELPHDLQNVFCCSKDRECWPSLQECIPNCPCKVNCGMKKKNNSAEAVAPAAPPSLLHG